MLNEEPVSKRLKILRDWCAGVRTGEFTLDEHRAKTMETMLGECAIDVERLEIATGEATVAQQLRAAGGNVVALKAVLSNAALNGRRA